MLFAEHSPTLLRSVIQVIKRNHWNMHKFEPMHWFKFAMAQSSDGCHFRGMHPCHLATVQGQINIHYFGTFKFHIVHRSVRTVGSCHAPCSTDLYAWEGRAWPSNPGANCAAHSCSVTGDISCLAPAQTTRKTENHFFLYRIEHTHLIILYIITQL